jgi:hypothetical protein
MIIVGDTLVSEELFEEHFVCDLSACKGQCCVEGESGAPLELDEIEQLENVYDIVEPYLRPEGVQSVKEKGLYQVDYDGDFVTTLVGEHGECAYAVFDENGIAKCALEQAWLDGKTTWKKPISCHLYPIRLAKLPEYTAVNYHRWQVCKPACECGSKLKVPVYKFLKEPLVRKFGESWFQQLEVIAQEYLNRD